MSISISRWKISQIEIHEKLLQPQRLDTEPAEEGWAVDLSRCPQVPLHVHASHGHPGVAGGVALRNCQVHFRWNYCMPIRFVSNGIRTVISMSILSSPSSGWAGTTWGRPCTWPLAEWAHRWRRRSSWLLCRTPGSRCQPMKTCPR